MALPLAGAVPTTVNLAISPGTVVRLEAFDPGWVSISSEGFGRVETHPGHELPFHGPYGLFFAAVSHFGFHGLRIAIRAGFPVRSGLGGSSTALVALLHALSRLRAILGGKPLRREGLLRLGFLLEDAVSSGHCGMQDQAAAVYGGVNQWVWRFGGGSHPFSRKPLLDACGRAALSARILVAHSGKSHVSSRTNRKWIGGFQDGTTRRGWLRANEITHSLARALEKRDWEGAAGFLREEMAVRRKITPEALIPLTHRLIDRAEGLGCGARFAGAGAGGAVWALGEKGKIRLLRQAWEELLRPHRGAGILDCRVQGRGVHAPRGSNIDAGTVPGSNPGGGHPDPGPCGPSPPQEE